jgi:hypothetical protein
VSRPFVPDARSEFATKTAGSPLIRQPSRRSPVREGRIGAEHTFANPGVEPAIILNTFTPDLYVGYFRDLGKLAAAGDMTPEKILAAMARYATYRAGTPAPDEPAPD